MRAHRQLLVRYTQTVQFPKGCIEREIEQATARGGGEGHLGTSSRLALERLRGDECRETDGCQRAEENL